LNIEASEDEEVIMEKFFSVATRPIKGKECGSAIEKDEGKGMNGEKTENSK
jgi:hypothetical protein